MATLILDWADEDNNTGINLDAAYQAGVRMCILRSIYGRPYGGSTGCYIDKTWADYKDAVIAAKMKRSTYLFLCYPNKGMVTPEPEVQAQALIDYVGNELGSNPLTDFVPFYDVEETSNMLNEQEMYDWTVRCAQALYNFYKVWPGQYSSNQVWSDNMGSHAAGVLIDTPQWTAKPWYQAPRQPINLAASPDTALVIPAFAAYVLYQRQGDALGCPGFNSTVDVSVPNVIRLNDSNGTVAWIQKRIGVTADGNFGPMTEAAVKDFQTKNGLTADGIVGLDTYTPLSWVKLQTP
jgi:hypothetical protein